MDRLFAAVLVALPLALAAAAPVPTHMIPKNEFYYSTTVGVRWVYEYEATKVEHAFVITQVKDQGDTKVVSVGIEELGKIRPYSDVAVSKGGLIQASQHLLKLPFQKNLKWNDDTDLHTIHSTEFAPEEVKVPAGTFQAIKVCTTYCYEWAPGRPIFNGPNPNSETRWYAAGVGLVKRANGTRLEGVCVLKSFGLGTTSQDKK